MKNNSNILTYFLARSLFLGGGISILFLYSDKDAYISVILGSLLGIVVIYLINYFKKKINMPLNLFLKNDSILSIIIKIILIGFILFGIFVLLVILSTFLYSYFLPFTPSIISCLPFIFLASFLNTKSIKKIIYVAQILFVISIVLIILKTCLLTNEFDFNNLLPFFTTKPANIFKTSLIFAVLSTAPFITLVDENINFKNSLKYYLISSLTILVVVLTLTIVLGNLVNIYSYPEYSVLRKISFFKFIENIENFISVGWFFDIFICMSVSSLKIKNIINVKKSYIPFLINLILLIIVNQYTANNFYNSMIIYKSFPTILFIFMILLFMLIYIKILTNKKAIKN